MNRRAQIRWLNAPSSQLKCAERVWIVWSVQLYININYTYYSCTHTYTYRRRSGQAVLLILVLRRLAVYIGNETHGQRNKISRICTVLTTGHKTTPPILLLIPLRLCLRINRPISTHSHELCCCHLSESKIRSNFCGSEFDYNTVVRLECCCFEEN